MMNIPEPVYIVLFLTFSGLIIRTCLVIVGQSWSKTYHYLGTYILLPNIAYVVTTVIANNIALSLGMIGALSIVRFRHPVRSHFELTMFFALITLPLCESAISSVSTKHFIGCAFSIFVDPDVEYLVWPMA